MKMALRSQEEVSLATVFARTLRSVIALTAAEDRRVYPDAGEVLRTSGPDETAPAALVRLLQFSILPEILGESAGPAIYLASKRSSRDLGVSSIQGLKDWFAQMKLGELEVELDEERVLVKLHRCLSCERLPATGTPVCDVERGIIDGVLEDITGTEVLTKETMCWSLGDTVCQFEGYAGKQAGYLYSENGFHPVEQRRLLTQLADQADTALDNLRLLHERKEHETHDPLTGLLNFRSLRERAAFELARAERHGRSVAFAMLDLDGFTEVNETAGREAGDEVLRHWAAALTAQLRSCDLVCRYGADEFLLVMPETADQQVDAVLARVLGAMRQLAVETADRPIALTASAGVASFPLDGRSAEELVAKAATTMYAARAGGPGKVAFYSGPPRG
jgi:diguanylate cyclase (GGDEF)-like protein